MRTVTVPPGEARALKRFLAERFPLAQASAVRRALERRDVKRGGARLGAADMVFPGDALEVYIADETLFPQPTVLYEDEDILVVHKLRSIPSVGEEGEPSMQEAVRRAYPSARACHRLDSATCGALLFALRDAAHERMLAAFKARDVGKLYRCVVRGAPEPPEATMRAFLRKDEKAARVSILPKPAPGAPPIETRYATLEGRYDQSLLSVEIPTGRTHQIRAQMAAIGHPLLGDDLYGDRAFNRAHKARRLLLQSVELRLPGGIVARDEIECDLLTAAERIAKTNQA